MVGQREVNGREEKSEGVREVKGTWETKRPRICGDTEGKEAVGTVTDGLW